MKKQNYFGAVKQCAANKDIIWRTAVKKAPERKKSLAAAFGPTGRSPSVYHKGQKLLQLTREIGQDSKWFEIFSNKSIEKN